MSFNSFLHSLRNKPEHVRRHIALWSSLGVTAVIFMFWLASFTATITGQQNPVTVAMSKAGTPVQSLVANASSFLYDIRDMIFGPKKVQYSNIEVLPGGK
jgi:hypothetical protein